MGLLKGIDNMDVAVIDEDLVAAALVEEAGGDQQISSMATFELAQTVAEAATLRLSYKNILSIDNLQGFTKLNKLCLDNNIIGEITNLDHLVHLTWLDLSFNNIHKIEGLGALTKLTDLSLYNNQIAEIEGLDGCRQLQCLSLGNNKIASLDNIIKLRKFMKLQLVNLEGNPVCKEAEYRSTMLAYLRCLQYHDYTMVDPQDVAQAREQYHDELLDLEEKEALEDEKGAREQAMEAENEQLRGANLLAVKVLFPDMFSADAEMAKLRHLPGIEELIEHYKNHVAGAAETFKTAGLEKAVLKRKQVELFDAAVTEMRADYASRSAAMVEEFNRQKKRTFKELASQEAVDASDLATLKFKLDQLQSSLMDLEIYQVDQYEQLMNGFEAKYGEQRAACLDLHQQFFRAVEEHEENYFAAVQQLAQDILDKASRNELPEDIPEELANIVLDRDQCLNSVVSSHDIHVGKLLAREDETRASENKAMTIRLDTRARQEQDRNRGRVMEIRDFFESNRRQINDLISSKVSDDYDDPEGG